MKKLILLSLSLFLAVCLFGQYNMPRPDMNPFRIENSNLFNPNQIKLSHSLGFEAGSSSTGHGYYLSRYTSHLNYKLSPSWDAQLNLNFVNFGSAITNSSIELNDDNTSKVLPDFSIRYKPSDSFQFSVHVQQGLYSSPSQSSWFNRW
ncbi:MAG: hypothetical protein PHI68_03995 [Candidatus Cloacimonetes bacterium]|nr:hypothetical protein [Candidatus Cloacimonadota bacterium]